ncbi:hypothetical protein A1Q2_07499 [Trichosporon asahii var. asahii CBS 8904]|uniref:N-alpha-acetyltransferase 40 n=1 Tax=Trichosporon asahii var. asahii (strain CBS 8904) TaxID=1220162 RepID=K1VND5_TRIAC|nr:hypothetical protein A1Q2_07499 [Trichosporon asahii var. asahii CBS 8904]
MATPKVRAACAASVGELAPELPCTLDLGAGNPLPTASADSSPTSTAISPHITSRPLEDGKDARPSSAGSAGSAGFAGSTVSAASAGLSGSTNSAGPGSSKAKANGGSPSGVGVTKGLKRARMTLKTATELSQSEKEDLFSLWKANMGHYAHLDYTDAGKWEEMYDADARYLIIRRSTSTSPSSSPLSRTLKLASVSSRSGGKEKDKEKDKDKENGGGDGKEKERRDEGAGEGRKRRRMRRRSKDQDHGELLGFASFRFDTEETMSPQDAEVVYCYELQLSPCARGLGLARRLMDALEGIGRRRGMAKSMLTCLVANTSALGFYERQGYTPDEIDPTRCAEEEGEEAEYTYRILSKEL